MPTFAAPLPETSEPAIEEVARAPQPPAPPPDEPAVRAQDPDEDKTPRRSTVREKVSFFFNDSPAPQEASPPPAVAPAPPELQPPAEPAPSAPRRMGWWSK